MNIYQDEIMDHYRNPRNFGCKMVAHNTSSNKRNISCGDELTIHAHIEDGVVTDICFEGAGCALSTASASLLTSFVKGKRVDQVRELGADEVLNLLKIQVTPARLKCALLPLDTIQESIENYKGE
ncbi:iron-sulfur cluster assembly scaffold protein [Candidatus Woesebacteria bacterium]|nr:iron-sulfur cluster assembly scaffold protein [Candidatus Woesebacteria bacterium]